MKGRVKNNNYELTGDFSKQYNQKANASINYWNKDRYEGQVEIDDWIVKRDKGKYIDHYQVDITIQTVQ